MSRSRTIWALALLAAACGDEPAGTSGAPMTTAQAASGAQRPTKAPSEEAPARSSVATPASSAPQATTRRPLADQRRRVRTLVTEARAAARRDARDEAIRGFEAALSISPRDPRLHCELGYLLSELDPATAERHLDRGLALFGDPQRVARPLRVPLAMCLYNMGRLLEAGEEPSEAQWWYEDSLALRDNAIVRERLRAVRALEHSPGEPFDVPTIAALVQRLQTPRACTDAEARESGEDTCVDGYEVLATIAASGSLPDVGWLESHVVSDMVDEARYEVAFRRPDGFYLVTAVEHSEDNTDHGHSGEGSLTPGVVSVLSNGWLRMEYEETFEEGSDMFIEPEAGQDSEGVTDCWMSETSSSTERGAVLCRFDDGIRCARLVLASRGARHRAVHCTGGGDERVETPAWARAYEVDASGLGHEIAIDAEGGRARLRTVRAPADADSYAAPLDRFIDANELWDALEELYVR